MLEVTKVLEIFATVVRVDEQNLPRLIDFLEKKLDTVPRDCMLFGLPTRR